MRRAHIAIVLLAACSSSPQAIDGAVVPDARTPLDGGAPADDAASALDAAADAALVPDTGADDASSTSPDGGAAESADLLAILDAYEHGGDVDFEHDGVVDVTIVAHADGTYDDTLFGMGGAIRQHTTWRGPNDYDLTGDQDVDGTIDYRAQSSLTSTEARYVEERDDDVDGVLDHRVMQVTSIASGRPTTVDSTAEELVADGSWVTTGGYTTSESMLACGSRPSSRTSSDRTCSSDADCHPGEHCGRAVCDCWWDGLPTTLAAATSIAEPIGAGGRFVALRSGPYACDDAQVALLSIAVRAAEVTIDTPLRSINDGFADRLYESIARRRVVYGCANPVCADATTIAITESHGVFADDARGAITTLGPSVFASGEIAVTEIVAHEWFHLDMGKHPDDPGGDHARDYIYACSRFMNGCRGFSHGFYLGIPLVASSARDAALCADSDHKQRFGVTVFPVATDDYYWESAPGTRTSEDLAWCRTDAMAAPSAACLCMIENTWTYCDETPARARDRSAAIGQIDTPSCCLTCPVSAPLALASCPATETPAPRYAYPAPVHCPDVGGCGY